MGLMPLSYSEGVSSISSFETVFEILLDQAIKLSGKTIEEIADIAGVSRATLYRHKGGVTKNGYTTEDCVVKLVDGGVAEPNILPVYCACKCQVGEARERYHLKKKRPLKAAR